MIEFFAFRQKKYLALVLAGWLCSQGLAVAQHGCVLLGGIVEGKNTDLEDTVLVEIHPDTLACLARLSEWRRQAWAEGHLEASVDARAWRRDTLVARLHKGPAWRWAALELDALPVALRARPELSRRVRPSGLVRPQEVAALFDMVLDWHANHGYPFASVWLEAVQATDSVLHARVAVDPGPLITMGAVVVEGELRLSPDLLARHLGLAPGMPFSREKIAQARQRVEQLPYVRLLRAPWVTFYGTEARLHLPLAPRPASRLDLLVGIQPSRQAEGRRVRLTGTAHGEWHNALGLGEHLLLHYEQLQPRSPRLRLLAEWPWVPVLPFGLFGAFDLYKRDTLFLDLSWRAGMHQLLPAGHTWRVFVRQQVSTLLSASTATSGQLDLQQSALGMALALDHTDYRFNPRRGWQLALDGSAGLRRILENEQLLETDPHRYDSLALRAAQLRFELDGAHYLPLGRQMVWMSRLRGAAIAGGGAVWQNEAWRLGGNRLLRGFDEDAFFARHYVVLTLEGRLLLDRNSFLYLFADAGWWQAPVTNSDDRGLGIGAGVTFATRGGILQLSLATGRSTQIPFDLANPRVHVGYTSRF